MFELVTPPQWATQPTFGLSKGAVSDQFILTAGMAINFAPGGEPFEINSIEQEVGYCLRSIETFLKMYDRDRKNIVKMTVFVDGKEYIGEVKEALLKAFGPGTAPVINVICAGVAGTCRVELESVVVAN